MPKLDSGESIKVLHVYDSKQIEVEIENSLNPDAPIYGYVTTEEIVNDEDSSDSSQHPN